MKVGSIVHQFRLNRQVAEEVFTYRNKTVDDHIIDLPKPLEGQQRVARLYFDMDSILLSINFARKVNLDLEKPPSTRTAFDRQLKRVQRDVLRMGALVEESCRLACQALFERNLEAAEQIAQKDKQIDQLYRQIELDCVSTIALQAPVTQDLRLLSALMQLIRDLERIGDYAQDLGEIAMMLFPYPVHPCMGQIQIMMDRCRAMLAMSLEALSNLDADAGLEIKVKDDEVDLDYKVLYNLLTHQSDGGSVVEPIVLLVLVIRYLERMADHATNIGQRVAYIVTGQR